MQPSKPLEYEVNRGDIRNKQVKVNVERLLEHLRANNHQALWPPPVFRRRSRSEKRAETLFVGHAVEIGEA